ncbi:MAG: SDR family NAD(P)-dependent oxidoreductase [Caulobacterales bacterium]|nr:SDR family NAD(P)-dependent oxidoreductase [Caulobacterales bacterium]
MSRPRLKPLNQQTIAITGATSGIGLATARRAAERGARVFLIARGENDLRTLCEELQQAGGRAAYAVADVGDPEALAAAAEKCTRLFGGFDTWVNNAGVSIYGPIRETKPEDHRRLFETNYWGVVNGSLLASETLRGRDGGGAIITVGSVLGDAPLPVQGVYSASKHAVRGFTNALRMELIRERAPISITLVKPAAIDTPYKDHALNLTGQAMKNPGPVYAAHVVADVILHCASHPIREITVGGGGRLMAAFHHLVPGLAEPLFALASPMLHRDRQGDYRSTEDGLWDPTEDGLMEEVRYPFVRRSSLLAQARMHPRTTAGAVLGLFLIAAGAVAVQRLIGREAQEATGLRRWRSRFEDWRDSMGDRWRDLDVGGHFRRLDLPGRAGPVRDRAVRYARDHAVEGVSTLAAVAAILGAVAVAMNERRDGA